MFTNTSNDSLSHNEENSKCLITPLSVFRTFLVITLMFFGTGGNLLVCLAPWCDKNLRKLSSVFVMNLAMADFLFCTFCLPLVVPTMLCNGHWVFSAFVCQAMGLVSCMLSVASITTLFFYSIFRYSSVKPQGFCSNSRHCIVYIAIPLIWIESICLALPPVAGWGGYALYPYRGGCYLAPSTDASYIFVLFILAFLIPLIIMVLSYYKMFKLTHMHSLRLSQATTLKSRKDSVMDSESKIPYLYNVRNLEVNQPGTEDFPSRTNSCFSNIADNYEASKQDDFLVKTETVVDSSVHKNIRTRTKTDSNIKIIIEKPTDERETIKSERSNQTGENLAEPAVLSFHQIRRNSWVGDEVHSHKRRKLGVLRLDRKNSAVEDINTSRKPGQQTMNSVTLGEFNDELKDGTLFKINPGKQNTVAFRSEERRRLRERKLMNVLLVTVMVFALCWMPYCMDCLIEALGITDERPQGLQTTEAYLVYCSSCVNCVIYAVMNSQFRKAFRKMLCKPYVSLKEFFCYQL